MESLRRFDERLARVESALAVVVLLGMVLIASLQALFFNIAERGADWAQTLVESMSWADVFLQKATLWVAFLGASLATQKDKHIAVDVVPRLSTPKTSAIIRAIGSFGAGLIAFMLARVYLEACIVADQSLPLEYGALTPNGQVHVCDAPPELAATLERPGVLCALRAGLAVLNVPITSGEGIAQLIAPIMFVVIGLRLLFRSGAIAVALSQGKVPEAHHGEKLTDPATIDTPAHEPPHAQPADAKPADAQPAAEPAEEPKPDAPKGDS